jgi:hypothetical protein
MTSGGATARILGKEAKRYQVEQARDLLDRVGVHP